MARGNAMIAHQGGWDEILLVLGPIAVIVGLLMMARKRVEAAEQKGAAKAPATKAQGKGAKSPASPKVKR
jgi:hypothetical protein